MVKIAMTKPMYNKVMAEVESFKTEYPNFTSETVEEYVQLLDDFDPYQKALFIQELGF